MQIDRTTVEHMARLARIELNALSADDQQGLVEQMGKICAYIDLLGEVDTDGVEPCTHPVELSLRLREDRALPTAGVEQVLANAPLDDGHSFMVPQVVSEGGADE